MGSWLAARIARAGDNRAMAVRIRADAALRG